MQNCHIKIFCKFISTFKDWNCELNFSTHKNTNETKACIAPHHRTQMPKRTLRTVKIMKKHIKGNFKHEIWNYFAFMCISFYYYSHTSRIYTVCFKYLKYFRINLVHDFHLIFNITFNGNRYQIYLKILHIFKENVLITIKCNWI